MPLLHTLSKLDVYQIKIKQVMNRIDKKRRLKSNRSLRSGKLEIIKQALCRYLELSLAIAGSSVKVHEYRFFHYLKQ